MRYESWSGEEWQLVRETRSSEYRVNPRDGGSALAERFLLFGVSVISLVNKLPKTFVGRHIAGQLMRCGTSPGANYEEARGAESRADFVHKMGIVLKEMKESRYWLRLIASAGLLDSEYVMSLLQESHELCSITARGILTAKQNA